MSFKLITARKPEFSVIRVVDLIDHDKGGWRANMIYHIFLPVDAEVIKAIPLCNSWPSDRLMWHFSKDGRFSVKSTYQLICETKKANEPTPSTEKYKTFWKDLWTLDVPPKMRMFVWRVVNKAIPN